MKKGDIITTLAVLAVIGAFAFVPGAMDWFNAMTAKHGMIMSFFKFAILGTFGEMLALRIRKGCYIEKGFGLVPKMLVWGFLGVMADAMMTPRKPQTSIFGTRPKPFSM